MDFVNLDLANLGTCIAVNGPEVELPGYQRLRFDLQGTLTPEHFLLTLAPNQIRNLYLLAAATPYSHLLRHLPAHWEMNIGIPQYISILLRSGFIHIHMYRQAVVESVEHPQTQQLRSQINKLLQEILQEEKANALAIANQQAERGLVGKAGAYLAAFGTGLGNAAWDMAVWVKDVVELGSPALKFYRIVKAATETGLTTRDNEEWHRVFFAKMHKAEHKELVDVLGFDPNKISAEVLKQAYDTAMLIWQDEKSQKMLIQFSKDFLSAQHSLEVTEFVGGAAFELLLAAIIAALTGGAGAVAIGASKVRHAARMKKLGELFLKLAKQVKHYKQNAFGRLKPAKSKPGTNLPGPKTPKPEPIKIDQPKKEKKAVVAEQNKIAKVEEPKQTEISYRKGLIPRSLDDAANRLKTMRTSIETNGHQPKYSDAELLAMADSGTVPRERYQVRFMPKRFLNDRNAKNEYLSGKMGGPFYGDNAEGVKYWSTSFDQLEDADTDPKLISEKVGIDYTPDDYVLIIVDSEKAAQLSGSKAVTPTFRELGEFAVDELPSKYSKADIEAVYNAEFQEKYSTLYKQAEKQGIDLWDEQDRAAFEPTLIKNGIDPKDFENRIRLHGTLGSNEDFLGNGVTKNLIDSSSNQYGVVETFTFDTSPQKLSTLEEKGAIKIVDNLSIIGSGK